MDGVGAEEFPLLRIVRIVLSVATGSREQRGWDLPRRHLWMLILHAHLFFVGSERRGFMLREGCGRGTRKENLRVDEHRESFCWKGVFGEGICGINGSENEN